MARNQLQGSPSPGGCLYFVAMLLYNVEVLYMTSSQGSEGTSKGRTASPMYCGEIEFIPDTTMVYIVPSRTCYII